MDILQCFHQKHAVGIDPDANGFRFVILRKKSSSYELVNWGRHTLTVPLNLRFHSVTISAALSTEKVFLKNLIMGNRLSEIEIEAFALRAMQNSFGLTDSNLALDFSKAKFSPEKQTIHVICALVDTVRELVDPLKHKWNISVNIVEVECYILLRCAEFILAQCQPTAKFKTLAIIYTRCASYFFYFFEAERLIYQQTLTLECSENISTTARMDAVLGWVKQQLHLSEKPNFLFLTDTVLLSHPRLRRLTYELKIGIKSLNPFLYFNMKKSVKDFYSISPMRLSLAAGLALRGFDDKD